MVKAGYEVVMITGHNAPKYEIKEVNGIMVHYLPVFYENKMTYPSRIWAFSKFMVWAFFLSLKIKNISLCYASSTPMTIGVLALFIKKAKRIPYFFEVRDLWPEAPQQLGILTFKPIIVLAKFFEKKIYLNARLIVALSPSMKLNISAKKIDKEIVVIPNMADCSFFSRIEESEKKEIKLEKGLAQKLVIAYFGALGKANDLSRLLDLAEKLRKHPIHFLILGSGSEEQKLEAQVRSSENVEFLGYKNKFELKGILDYVDAAYISFAKFPILETNSPNKFFDGLAAGKVILTNTKGWLKEIIESEACGFYVNENDESDLQKVIKLSSNPDQVEKLSEASRRLAEEQFSRQKLTSKLIKIISQAGTKPHALEVG